MRTQKQYIQPGDRIGEEARQAHEITRLVRVHLAHTYLPNMPFSENKLG